MASAEPKSGALMVALLLVGVALLLGAAWPAGSHLAFLSRATIIEARIVDFHLEPRSGSSTRFWRRATYEFALPDGSLQRAVGPVCRERGCSERVGAIVRVGYDPAEPDSVRRLGFHDAWALPAALGGFGALWTAIAGLFLWMCLREARLEREGASNAASRCAGPARRGRAGADDGVRLFGWIIGAFLLAAVAAALGGFPGLAAMLVGFALVWLALGWLVTRDGMWPSRRHGSGAARETLSRDLVRPTERPTPANRGAVVRSGLICGDARSGAGWQDRHSPTKVRCHGEVG